MVESNNSDPVIPTVDRSRVVNGILLRCVDGLWRTQDGSPVPENPLLVVSMTRVIQQWRNQRPIETIWPDEHNRLPDVDELNSRIPREDWEIGRDRKPREPYELQAVVYLFDPDDGQFFTFASSTHGAGRAVKELENRVEWMRATRGRVVPRIELASKPMPTQYGMKKRPDLKVVGWQQLATKTASPDGDEASGADNDPKD